MLRPTWRSSHDGLGGSAVIRWKVKYVRVALALGALLSVAVASGAGARWQ